MTEPEDTDIQRLIRLKRYEQPPEGFVDDFLINFHHRQRSEILRQSSLSLFWERLVTFMDGRAVQGMGLAGATAALLILGGTYAWNTNSGSSSGSPATAAAATPSNALDNGFSVAGTMGLLPEDKATVQPDDSLAIRLNSGNNQPTTAENALLPDVQFVAQATNSKAVVNGVMMIQNGSAANLGQRQWVSPPVTAPGAHSLSPWFLFYFEPGTGTVEAK